jgi:hypothetical protein
MDREQFESLKSLILDVFEKASACVDKRARERKNEVPADEITKDLIEQFSILRFADSPKDMEELVGFLIGDHLLPPDMDTEDFFGSILTELKGRNRSHAHNNAELALRLLSNAYEAQKNAPASGLH